MMSLEGSYKVLCTLGYVNYCLVNYCKSLVHVGSIILNANYYYYYYLLLLLFSLYFMLAFNSFSDLFASISRNVLHCIKMKSFTKDFFSKCDQIRRKPQIWSHLLKKFLMGNFIFCAVNSTVI